MAKKYYLIKLPQESNKRPETIYTSSRRNCLVKIKNLANHNQFHIENITKVKKAKKPKEQKKSGKPNHFLIEGHPSGMIGISYQWIVIRADRWNEADWTETTSVAP